MKIFMCDNFRGYYPVGTSALIVAANKKKAIEMLLKELENMGLKQNEDDIKLLSVEEVDIHRSHVNILQDGNY